MELKGSFWNNTSPSAQLVQQKLRQYDTTKELAQTVDETAQDSYQGREGRVGYEFTGRIDGHQHAIDARALDHPQREDILVQETGEGLSKLDNFTRGQDGQLNVFSTVENASGLSAVKLSVNPNTGTFTILSHSGDLDQLLQR